MTFRETYGERKPVNKWGLASNCDNGVLTDIWDGANFDDNQPEYLLPTEPRVHQLASSSASDTMEIEVFALEDWDTPEAKFTYTLNGTTNVPTIPFVAINEMKARGNTGRIKAIADTDGTTTAQIEPGNGETEMCLYGVASTEGVFIVNYFASLRDALIASAKIQVVVNDNPQEDTTIFRKIHGFSLDKGLSVPPDFIPLKEIDGPCFIKFQGIADSNNDEITAGFNGYRIEL